MPDRRVVERQVRHSVVNTHVVPAGESAFREAPQLYRAVLAGYDRVFGPRKKLEKISGWCGVDQSSTERFDQNWPTDVTGDKSRRTEPSVLEVRPRTARATAAAPLVFIAMGH